MGSEYLEFGHCAIEVSERVEPPFDSDKGYIGLEHIAQDELRITEVGKPENASSTKNRFRQGDILFGKLRPYFRKVARPNFEGICSTDIWVVRCRKGVDQGFLFYWMASRDFVNYANQGSEGTKMPRAKWGHVKSHRIPLKTLSEQRAIAHILGSLDDKIELNRKQNATLEGMAQALFQSWFVDFDPVIDKALAAGHEIPEPFQVRARRRAALGDRRKSLPPEIAALFPDRFVETAEMGFVPAGWGVGKAREFYDISIGKTPPRGEFQWFSVDSNDVKWVSIRDMGEAGLTILETKEYLTKSAITRFNIQVVPKGTVLVSFKLTVGRVAMASEDLCTNEAIAHFKHSKCSPGPFWTYLYLKQYNYDLLGSTSSIAQATNSKVIKDMTMLAPPKEILEVFEGKADVFLSKVQAIEKEIATLTHLRDTLLPKLITGEIRVGDLGV